MFQRALFYNTAHYPAGFTYKPDFISRPEETALLALFRQIEFRPYVYEGHEAKRYIKSFHKVEGYPKFIIRLMERVAEYAETAAIEHVLVTRYAPGAPIGWHRDMPPYDTIIGISLGSAVPFRFRRKHRGKWERITILAEPRSLYTMTGAARYEWQHSIPPAENWRYSITMRTVK